MVDINTNIKVDSTKAQSDFDKLDRALRKSQSSLDKLNQTMNKSSSYTRKAQNAGDKYSRTLSNIERHARTTNSALVGLEIASKAVSNIWRIILGYQIAKNLLKSAAAIERTAQKVELLSKKMKVLTKETLGFEILIEKAYESGIAMDTLGSVVGRFSVATKGAFSVDVMGTWAENLVLAGRAAGTTAKEIDSTLLQLSQAFSANALQGEELRAIRENAPLYLESLRAIADEAGHTGITIKEMGAKGLLGTDMMVKALDRLGDRVAQFEGLTTTLESATTRMNDQWALLVADLYSGESIFTNLADSTAAWLKELRESGEAVDFFAESLSFSKNHLEQWDLVLGDTMGTLSQFKYIPAFIMDGFDQLTQLVSDDDSFISLLKRSFKELPANLEASLGILIAHFKFFFNTVAINWDKWVSGIKENFSAKMTDVSLTLLWLKKQWHELFDETTMAARATRDIRLINEEVERGAKLSETAKQEFKDRIEVEKKARAEAIASALAQNTATLAVLKSAEEEFKIKKEYREQEARIDKMFRKEQQKLDLERKAALKIELDAEAKLQAEKKKADTALKKSTKLMSDYGKSAIKMMNDLKDLQDPIAFELKIDTSKVSKEYIDQLEKLNDLRKLGSISIEENSAKVREATQLYNDLVKATKVDFLRELSYEFDEVAEATYDANLATAKLKKLFETTTIDSKLYNEELIKIAQNLLKVKAANDELTESEQVYEGIRSGLFEIGEESESTFELMSDATVGAFDGMTDALADFVTTGKLDFSDLVDSILADLARIAIQKAITEPLANALFSSLPSLFGGASAISPTTVSMGNYISPTIGAMSANGDVFDNGSLQKFANGDIFNTPHVFPMANGAVGLFAEEGPEAIMPLTRGSDGKLGVQASGGGNKTIVNVYNNSSNSESTTKETTDSQGNKTIDVMIEEKINSAIQNGSLDKQMGSTYGVKRRGF